jgi:hypothetical protein
MGSFQKIFSISKNLSGIPWAKLNLISHVVAGYLIGTNVSAVDKLKKTPD